MGLSCLLWGAYWYVVFGAVHEVAHVVAATVVGCGEGCRSWENVARALFGRSVALPSLPRRGWRRAVATHAGWLASVSCAVLGGGAGPARRAAAWATAVEAVASDLLGACRVAERGADGARLFCGKPVS